MKETVTRVRCDICRNIISDLNGHAINIRGQIFDVCGRCSSSFNQVVQFLTTDVGIPIDYEYVIEGRRDGWLTVG